MRVIVEISLYPFIEEFVPPIKDFISRLRNYENLEIVVNATSTLIKGKLTDIFDALSKEIAETFKSNHHVFVMKVLNFERDIHKQEG